MDNNLRCSVNIPCLELEGVFGVGYRAACTFIERYYDVKYLDDEGDDIIIVRLCGPLLNLIVELFIKGYRC